MEISTVSNMNSGASALKSTVAAMDSMFGISDSTMNLVNTAAAMMQIAMGGAQIIATAITAKETLNTIQTAKAAALTAANSAVPGIGWGKIALGLAAAGAAAVVTDVIMNYTLSGDMNTSSGRASISGAVGGMV